MAAPQFAVAPNYVTFIVGRAMVGIVVGGFWPMSAATAMRLVPLAEVPQALVIVNGGNALAAVIAAPLGSFLDSMIGWRGAFFLIVPVAVLGPCLAGDKSSRFESCQKRQARKGAGPHNRHRNFTEKFDLLDDNLQISRPPAFGGNDPNPIRTSEIR